MSTPPNEGWFGPAASRRFHYFGADGRSLCGKWLQLSPPQAYGLDWNTSLSKASGDCAEQDGRHGLPFSRRHRVKCAVFVGRS